MSTEALLEKGLELDRWLDSHINGLEIIANNRTRCSASCFDQVHEHSKAIRLLINQTPERRLTGSAFSLVRPMFETFVRGVWLLHAATDKDVEKYASDDEAPRIQAMLDVIEAKPGYAIGVLSRIKKTAWNAMCSYAHGGQFQIVRRMTESHIKPAYPDDEIQEVVRFALVYALLAGFEAFQMSGKDDLVEQVVARAKELVSDKFA